jgi:hypothetical protein
VPITLVARASRAIAWMALVCWGFAWRALVVLTVGGPLVPFLDDLLFGPYFFGWPFSAMVMVVGISPPICGLIGAVLGLVTCCWVAPPQAARRYVALMGVLGAAIVGAAIAAIFFEDELAQALAGDWRTRSRVRGGWGVVALYVLLPAACGLVSGWWGARAHLARRARAEREAAPPGRADA